MAKLSFLNSNSVSELKLKSRCTGSTGLMNINEVGQDGLDIGTNDLSDLGQIDGLEPQAYLCAWCDKFWT